MRGVHVCAPACMACVCVHVCAKQAFSVCAFLAFARQVADAGTACMGCMDMWGMWGAWCMRIVYLCAGGKGVCRVYRDPIGTWPHEVVWHTQCAVRAWG